MSDNIGIIQPFPFVDSLPSPTSVAGTEMVPMVVFAGTKRPRKSGPTRRSPRRKSAPPSSDEDDDDDDDDDDDEESSGRREDDDDDGDDDDGDDGDDDGDDEVEKLEVADAARVIIQGELRSDTLAGTTNRGDPLFWQIRYRRDARGFDACWICGTNRWSAHKKAAVWGYMYAEQIHAHFSLSTFVENFVDFASTRERCYVVPADPARTEPPGCPIPNLCMASYKKISVRRASNAELSLPEGTYLPRAVWRISLDPIKSGPPFRCYLLWSVWTRSPLVMSRLIRDWGNQRPNASLKTIDNLADQVRVPKNGRVVPMAEIAQLGQAINYEPAPVPAAGAAAVLPAL